MQEVSAQQGDVMGGPAEEEIDFRQFAGVLWAGRWLAAFIASLIILVGGFFIFLMPPVYQADATVQVEDRSSKGAANAVNMQGLITGGNSQAEAEIQILTSRMILSQVVQALNLEISAVPNYFPVVGAAIARRYHGGDVAKPWFGLSRHAWGGESIQLSTLNIPDDLAGTGALVLRVTDSGYSIFGDGGRKLIDGKIGEPASAPFPSGNLEIFVRSLKGRPGEEFLISRIPIKYVLDGLQGGLSVLELGKKSGVIQLTFQGSSANYVVQVLDEIEKAYVRQNVERRSAEAQQSLEFLKSQLPDARAKMSAAQSKLNGYQEQRGSVDVTEETAGVLRQTVDLDTKRLELEQARQQALQRFTPQHPSVVALDEQLQLLTKQQGKMQGEIGKLPKTQQEILSLTNDLKVSTQLYTDMLDTIQQLQVTEAGTIGNVRIIDRPLRPLLPSKPKRVLLLAAVVIMALILSCGIVLMRHLLRHGVEDPIEVEREFGLATYATIPFATEQRQLWRRQGGEGGTVHPLLAVRSPSVPAVEALRSLRTSLHFAMLEAPNNIVMLTGPSPGLGKTFVSANLSVVLASAGKTVLTIDADLRRGRLHEYFGLVNNPGLSDYIAGDIDFGKVAQKTEIEGLSVVARGSAPPNPAELLMSEHFSAFLDQAAKKFDYVLIDTPPVLAVTDAALIGRLAGTSFVVLKAGEHPLREIAEVLRRLQRSGVNVKGAVFNQAGGVGSYYGSSRYAYSYHSYAT